MINYSSYTITLSEMPGYIALAFSFTGCKVGCKDCHSKYLWDKELGSELTPEVFTSIVKHYEGYIDAVLFLGDIEFGTDLADLLITTRDYNLTVGIYTGMDLQDCGTYLQLLDYVKFGPYKKELGGLDSLTTNQRYVRAKDMKDLTHLFQNTGGM
jgi:anaerobic ribonucleoside-triphosphate reductase activating protein